MFGKPILHGAYLTAASGDALFLTPAEAAAAYLRIDTSNDPLTGTLDTQIVRPDGDVTRDLGSTSRRWLGVYGSRLRMHGGTITNFSAAKSGAVIGHVYKNGANGTARLRPSASSANYNLSTVIGEVRKTGTSSTLAEIASTGGGSLAGGLVTNAAGQSYVLASGNASFAWGLAGGAFSSANSRIISSNIASFAGGQALDTALVLSGGTSSIQATGAASFAWGRAVQNYYSASITATAFASMAIGGAFNGGTITATSAGAFAHGHAQGGTVTASGNGSFANGKAYYGSLSASGAGSFISGYGKSGNISATGKGAFAVGYTYAYGAIGATADNAAQFGVGTNSVADTLRVGAAGLHFKGTTGAFGTPLNGQVWMAGAGNAFVLVRSNGKSVQINTGAAAWTAGTFGTRRSFAGLTAPVVTAYGAAITETRELVETLIEELQAANLIN